MPEGEKIGIAVQVRMGSRRLPGKALLEIGGRPLLLRLCERMKLCKRADDLAVATSEQPADDPIENACRAWGIPVYRGAEQDLTSRLLGAARWRGWTAMVRVTGDNPLTSPEGVDELIAAYEESQTRASLRPLIVHNAHRAGYPYGTGAEVASRNLLEACDKELIELEDREYFMQFAREHPARFPCLKLNAPVGCRRPEYFLTIDYHEDFSMHEEIYGNFGGRDDMRTKDIIEFLDENPKIAEANAALHTPYRE